MHMKAHGFMLKIENLSLDKGDFSLRDISLEVNKGEFMTIVGPTGSGKTLLLETLVGVNRMKAGRIILDGRDISRDPIGKRDIGIVYQKLFLFPNMDVRQNIMFALRHMRLSRSECGRRFDEMVEMMGIEDIISRSIYNLSGGERQRVALARTMIQNRRLLLLDEPFAALDSITKWDILKQLKSLYNLNKMTVIHVTHDIEEAMFLSDKLGVMDGGRIIQTGSTCDVYEKPVSEQCAQLVKKENIFLMKYDAAEHRLYNANISLYKEGLKDGSEYLVHIPPQDIILSNTNIVTSARNTFQGVVTNTTITSYGIKVNISFNKEEITAFITKRSLTELGLKADARVYLIFKSGSVEVS